MSRSTLRSILAVVAVALVAAVPAIASAHRSGSPDQPRPVKAPVATVTSFADGVLVVSSGGLPVSGRVTPRTRIRWNNRGLHRGHGYGRGHAAHRGGDDTAGGMPSHGGMPTGGGMPSHGGLPTGGGLPPYGPYPRPTTADLKPGAALRDAELRFTPNGPVWKTLVLVRPAA